MTNIQPEGMRPRSVNKEKIKKKHQSNPEAKKKQKNPEFTKEIDLRDDPTHYLGKSQVKITKIDPSTETYRNILGDLNVLEKNPKLISGSEKVFNHACKDGKGYPEASDLQVRFVKELE
jgi:hypothetical protein